MSGGRAYSSDRRQRHTFASGTVMESCRPTRPHLKGVHVFIAILDFSTAEADRPAALAQLGAERFAVRAMPGCVNFRAFASPECETDITVLHEWNDETSFRAYLESEEFKRSGVTLRPLMSETPLSRRFRAELVESVA